MITTYLRKMLAAVVCLMTGLTAQAQFQGSVTQYPTNNYSNSPVNFKLTEVAQALETDTATLAKTYNEWQDAETWEGENLFWLIGANDVATDEPTADGKGFWMTADGERIVYGEGAVWFAFALVDAVNDVFSINCGQMPNVMKADDSGHAKFQLRFNGKSVNFDVTLNVVAKPAVDIPEPELAWAKLTIVDEITQEVNQKPRSGYDSDKVEVNLTEALVKLGVSADLVQDELRQLLFAKIAYITEDAAMGAQMSDSLTNESTAGGIGFWLRNVSDAEGTPTFECGNFGWDGDDAFFVESFAFDAESGILSCNLGQYPDNLKGGNTYFADLYIVYGTKAIKIRYNLNVEEVKTGTLEDYTLAGESTIRVEMEPMSSYDTKNFSIDIEGICAALGCTVGDLDDFYMLDGEIDFAGKNETAGGYWISMEGTVKNHGSGGAFYITPKADDFSKLGIGQMPNTLQVGDSARADVYFLANEKYYKLSIDLVIVEPKNADVVFQSVAQRSMEVQQVPGAYVWTSGTEIPAAWVEEQIGTSDWVLYALAPLNDDGTEKEGNAKYSKSYSITESPGFWMDGEGHNIGWNSNARVGVSVSVHDGAFSLMQYESSINLGDVFKFPLFLVNEENGKMVTFNIIYSIVESVEEIEVVGTEDLMLPLTVEGKSVTVDVKKAAEALGTTVDNLSNNKVLRGMTAEGTYGSSSDFFDGLTFDLKGNCVMDEGALYFEIEPNEDSTAKLTTYCNEAVDDDFTAMGQFCIQVGNKQYVYSVKFVSDVIFTGIDAIAVSSKKVDKIYDLQGREVKTAKRGFYIQNGRKFVK